jgi:hypothetical protein
MRERYGISRRDSDDLYPRMRDAHSYLSARDPAREKKHSPVGILRPLVGASLGAAAAGVLTGRLNHWNIPNTPIPIGAALGLAGLAIDYFDIAGPLSEDFGAAGAGAIASWITMMSTGWGQQLRAKAGQPVGQPITAGVAGSIGACASCPSGNVVTPVPAHAALPPPNYLAGVGARPRPLTEAEIAAMSHSMRPTHH